MENKIIDGKALSAKIRQELSIKAQEFLNNSGRKAGLAVVLVGNNSASEIYVKNKIKACEEVGINSVKHILDANTKQETLIELIKKLNSDKTIDGILVQLPLPKHMNEKAVLAAVEQKKDVDGFSQANSGALFLGYDCLAACTPSGCIELIKSKVPNIEGMHAVVIGRSNIVGKPVAHLLLQQNCTVTICHSKTKNLSTITKQADILIAAIGKKHFVTADMVKKDVIIIDVGINREGDKVYGDVDFDNCIKKASYITPVPGGVGPMTITMLISNTLKAANLEK